jgi:membrane protease YdiL (CAAX protease family)
VNLLGLDLGTHAGEKLMGGPMYKTILLLSVIAPLIEEGVFRWPLKLFYKKQYFKFVFWLSCLGFGLVHISNFELSPTVMWLTPLLILPQLVIGFFFAFIRVRLGVMWSIFLHAAYNFILSLPLLLLKITTLGHG